jgi:hypothetical protein
VRKFTLKEQLTDLTPKKPTYQFPVSTHQNSKALYDNAYIILNNQQLVPYSFDLVNCHLFHIEKSVEKNALFCRIGLDKFSVPPTYFLTGDSMAYRYALAFDAIPGSGIYASIGDTCPTTLIRPGSPKMSVIANGGYRCWLFHQHVFNYIKNNATTIKKVFVTSFFTLKLDESSHLDMIYAIREYATLSIVLYLIEQPPIQPLKPKELIANLKRLNNFTNISIRENSLSVNKFLEYDSKIYQPFLKRVQENSSFVHIYTRQYFCDTEFCPMGTTRELFYDDDVHISSARSFILIQLFFGLI